MTTLLQEPALVEPAPADGGLHLYLHPPGGRLLADATPEQPDVPADIDDPALAAARDAFYADLLQADALAALRREAEEELDELFAARARDRDEHEADLRAWEAAIEADWAWRARYDQNEAIGVLGHRAFEGAGE